jgi:hypothetical protein
LVGAGVDQDAGDVRELVDDGLDFLFGQATAWFGLDAARA